MNSATSQSTYAVLFLDRFGNPPYFARTFLRSLRRHAAGIPFDYFHVLKGVPDGVSNPDLHRYQSQATHPVQVCRVPDEQRPTGALYPVIASLPHERILMLLSWSRILAPGWLRCYADAFDTAENVGLVGATSGYERHDYRDLSLPFPNIGIRTNAYMIDRRLFCELAAGVSTREDEHAFESGADGLTKQIMRRGLVPVVVDRSGRVWRPEEWPRSRTFRSGHQEGLLIADNRTFDFDRGSDARRRYLARINWGSDAVVPHNPFWRLFWVRLKWNYLGL